ncbi:N(4)-(Beta-N-acetylglucosaminyl)-L-asparaginase-like [Neodiprion fabricii]|nr:N(4)-(Beta-N-acetylglucosaminyl)-L-asparaginase-like [Neodiprion fabricii]
MYHTRFEQFLFEIRSYRDIFIMRILNLFITTLIVATGCLPANSIQTFTKTTPLVVTTWDYWNATDKAWNILYTKKRSSLDAIEIACSLCEQLQCRTTVGFGGSPDEMGETTLDAMIMDGVKMDVGAVGGLRRIKNAISVARKVLDHTEHTLLSGKLATDFAVKMGFIEEDLQTPESKNMWLKWKANNCQPNFWKNVSPDPKHYCGPYKLTPNEIGSSSQPKKSNKAIDESNHDTIGMIAIDINGNIAAGTSTNGAKNKIPGRIGDSPIPGAGSYADQEVGAAAGTGDGDVMMRFLPSFLAVEEMRRGAAPSHAAETAVRRIAQHYPKFVGGVIALNKDGAYGAACNGMEKFPFYASNPLLGEPTLNHVRCIEI